MRETRGEIDEGESQVGEGGGEGGEDAAAGLRMVNQYPSQLDGEAQGWEGIGGIFSYGDDFTTDAITGDETDSEGSGGHGEEEGDGVSFRILNFFRERIIASAESVPMEKGLLCIW